MQMLFLIVLWSTGCFLCCRLVQLGLGGSRMALSGWHLVQSQLECQACPGCELFIVWQSRLDLFILWQWQGPGEASMHKGLSNVCLCLEMGQSKSIGQPGVCVDGLYQRVWVGRGNNLCPFLQTTTVCTYACFL